MTYYNVILYMGFNVNFNLTSVVVTQAVVILERFSPGILPALTQIVQIVRRRLIQIVVEPIGEQQARVASPAEQYLLFRIVVSEVICGNFSFKSFVDVPEVLVGKRRLVVFRMTENEYLSAVFSGYDMRTSFFRLSQDPQLRMLQNVFLARDCVA